MMLFEPELGKLSKLTGPFSRSESLSAAASVTTTSLGSHTTMATASSIPSSSHSGGHYHGPLLVNRNGRTYLRDPTQVYPLPVDLQEVHRQSLRTLLLIQIIGTPYCALESADRPPRRILEIGCGSGFWSMMCHRYLKDKGHPDVSFTGIDIVPLAPGNGGAAEAPVPDRDMKWRFVQHDIRNPPYPFEDGEFDHIMIKDMALATPATVYQFAMEEYLRVLRPGGTIELWETDLTSRMLRPHVPASGGGGGRGGGGGGGDEDDGGGGDDDDEPDENTAAATLGAYVMTSNTPLSAPLNPFLVEYNGWVVRALEARTLTAVACTLMGPVLLQEADLLCDVRSKRMALPLSEVRWEREGVGGVGGVVTKDGKSYVDWRGKAKAGAVVAAGKTGGGKELTSEQLALRRTALLTLVQQIQSLEPVLREVSGKSQDEWDLWCTKMMKDLLREGGTSWGECMETGAWWARKR